MTRKTKSKSTSLKAEVKILEKFVKTADAMFKKFDASTLSAAEKKEFNQMKKQLEQKRTELNMMKQTLKSFAELGADDVVFE